MSSDERGQPAAIAARPDPLTPGVAHHPGIVLHKLAQWGQDLFDAALSPLGMKTRHFATLANLTASPSRSQLSLGRKLGIDRTSMVKIIDDLERLGYVERAPHPGDRRAHVPRVTETGREAAACGERLLSAVETEIFSPLTPDEQATLHALLTRLFSPSAGAAGE